MAVFDTIVASFFLSFIGDLEGAEYNGNEIKCFVLACLVGRTWQTLLNVNLIVKGGQKISS